MRTLDPTLQRYGTDSIANEIGLESGSTHTCLTVSGAD